MRMPMNEQFLQWEVLLLGILVSGGFILFMDHTSDWILGLALLTGTALAVAKLDLFHPYTWYTPFFFLYAASVPILVWLELKEDIGDLQETVFLEWLALTVFLVVVGPTNRTIALPSRQIPCLKVMAWGLLLLSMAVSAAYLGHIWLNNLASKYEIALSPSVLARLDPAFSVYALVYTVLLAVAFQRRVFPWGLILFSLGWNALAFLLSGERDLVFRILWITVFLVHGLYRPISRWMLACIAVGVIMLVPILGDLKNVLLRDSDTAIMVNAMALRVLNDEFLTGSENLQYYLRNAAFEPFYFGETLLWDLNRAFLPGFIFPEGPDPQRYFNVTFFPEVVEQRRAAGVMAVGVVQRERSHADRDFVAVLVEADGLGVDGLAGSDGVDVREIDLEVGGAAEPGHARTDRLGRGVAEHPLGRRVPAGHPVVGVAADDGDGGGLDDGGEQLALFLLGAALCQVEADCDGADRFAVRVAEGGRGDMAGKPAAIAADKVDQAGVGARATGFLEHFQSPARVLRLEDPLD